MTQHFNPDRLEALRLAHGLTREEFAHRVGLTRQILHAWMAGTRRPTVKSIEQIAKAFDLNSDYFFADTVNHDGGHHVA